ncbi:porin family protein [Constantimarinum furrinae]|uniref:Outer membrane protein beta-barrel domain-containing protein n=1 Tax=Constantimarinum furrinae TaxID=2562285 RepID=A0A7G8PV78_9FLAO|nr:hypothetical protein [Constantimarinum furrinae]QNJ98244.1 hypothetical protein ALE3EI_1692 [Constantimarinum furrinae]
MNLNIKKILFCLCLFSVLLTSGQEIEEEDSNSSDWVQDDHFGVFKVGLYVPLVMGDNFANKALKQDAGVEVAFMVNIFDSPVLLGVNFNHFHADVVDPQLVGNYTGADINSIGPMIGYQVLNDTNWRGTVALGYGFVKYKNSGKNFDFSDSGGSLTVAPSMGYHFSRHIGAYGELAFRRDFLNIESPSELKTFFNGATYISFSLGVRIVI